MKTPATNAPWYKQSSTIEFETWSMASGLLSGLASAKRAHEKAIQHAMCIASRIRAGKRRHSFLVPIYPMSTLIDLTSESANFERHFHESGETPLAGLFQGRSHSTAHASSATRTCPTRTSTRPCPRACTLRLQSLLSPGVRHRWSLPQRTPRQAIGQWWPALAAINPPPPPPALGSTLKRRCFTRCDHRSERDWGRCCREGHRAVGGDAWAS